MFGKPYRVVTFGNISGDGNENGSWLTDDDLSQINPDEIIFHRERSEEVRLGDLRIFKGARRRAGITTEFDKQKAKEKADALMQKDKEEAEFESMKDSFHGFLRERS